jgi:nitroreductase
MFFSFPVKTTIDARRSARSYQMVPVNQYVMNEIKSFAAAMPLPFEHEVEVRFFRAKPTKTLYLMMKSPPDNAAFLSKTDCVSISKVGFVGEMLVLFAQSKGVSTCWYGHYKLAELERLMPHLQSNEQIKESNMGYGYSKGETTGTRAICITPLGYHEENGLRLMDRLTQKTISHKRKEIVELLENREDEANLSDDILYALDLGRKAPSAANTQMWRFGFKDDYRTVTVAMPQGYKHFKWEHPNVDIGICACHIWLGLVDKGHQPKVSVENEDGRAVWRLSIGK